MGSTPANDAPYRLIDDVSFGENVFVHPFTNLYGCAIGDNTRIGPYVEIQRGVVVGANCKIQSHTFICDGVTIEDEVFIGHGVMFINDKYPRATNAAGALQDADDWELRRTNVARRASIGSGAPTLLSQLAGNRAVAPPRLVARPVAPPPPPAPKRREIETILGGTAGELGLAGTQHGGAGQ